MADLRVPIIRVRVTFCETAVLFEMFPDEPKGLSWMIPIVDLPDTDGAPWRGAP